MVSVPALETDRLRLRGHNAEDLPNCIALWSDPLVTRYTTGVLVPKEECWNRLLRYVGHWALRGFGYWVAEEKTSGAFVGELGFADYKRELDPSTPNFPEAGWALASQVHGKGYATEGLRRILAWGEMNLPCEQTICLIEPANYKSIRVAEKCGYHQEALVTYKGSQKLLFARGWPERSLRH